MLDMMVTRHNIGESNPPSNMPDHVELFGDLTSANRRQPLWRYMKLSTLLLLLDGKAFFPSVAVLRNGDPLEGELCSDAAWLSGKLRELGGDEAANQLDEWLLLNADAREKEVQLAHRDDGRANSRLFAKFYVRELAKRRAVWCWFEADTESASMWTVYGHQGVAVGTTLELLVESLPSNRRFSIARILYVDRKPNSFDGFDPESVDGDPRIHRPHLIKGREYEHEHEIRIVTPCASQGTGVSVRVIDWSKLIRSIIISPLVPREERNAVIALLEKYPWQKFPEIRNSSILGHNPLDEERRAGLRERWEDSFGHCQEESDLPKLLSEL